jgi:CheY-like chemotaxis protein
MSVTPRCVLIDDDLDVLTMIAHLLRRSLPQWEVLPFQHSLEALAYVSGHKVDLVVTDFRMPEIDGLKLASHLRSTGNAVPVLVISGNPIEDLALAAGANGFLSKGDLPAQLGQKLAALGFQVGGCQVLPVPGP